MAINTLAWDFDFVTTNDEIRVEFFDPNNAQTIGSAVVALQDANGTVTPEMVEDVMDYLRRKL